jgi:hypothetical protein
MPFQNISPVKLAAPTALTSTVASLYTVPASTRTLLKDIDVVNTTGTALAITVYLVPSAGSPTSSNALLSAASIPANSTLQWSGNQVLNAGDTVQALGSNSGLTIHVSGAEGT